MVWRAPADVLPCSSLTLHLQNFGIDTEVSVKPPVHAHDVAFIRLGQETFNTFLPMLRNRGRMRRISCGY